MSSSDLENASSPGRDTIARSMSRYKGKRPGTPNCAPPMPKLDMSHHTIHSRQTSQPVVSSSGLSPRSDLPNFQSGDSVRDRDPINKAGRSRGLSSPKASNIRAGDTASKAEKQLGGGQSDHSGLAMPSATNNRPRSNSKAKDEAYVAVSHAVRPQTRHRDANPSVNGNGDLNLRNGLRTRNVEKIDQVEAPRDNGWASDSPHQVRHLRVESQRKIEKLDKSRIYDVKHTPLPKKSFSERIVEHLSKYQSSGRSNSKTDLKRLISTPIAMPEGGGVTTPSFDAPISAVNAGERRVIVQCKDSLISLPVTPTTTPLDIIRASAGDNSSMVNVKNSVLLESFKKVGLERPLRRYEHIRDVLNSWDNDAQNTLTVVPSATGGNDDDLEAKHVPKEQPGETTVFMYYSQKPGRWDKRWVTLRSDGQVVVRKTGKESINICHLSDFDIYIPTPRQLGKRIKPPKKICFAVKSQQKSSMFLSTANFVHFFSTNDKVTGTTWYKAVQQWRSWYLVNVMGEGQNGVSKAVSSDKFRTGKDPTTTNGILNGLYEKSPAAHDSHIRDRKDTGTGRIEAPQLNGGRQQAISTTAQENGHLATSPRKPKISPPISFPKNFPQPQQDLISEIPPNRAPGPAGAGSRNNDVEPFSSSGLLGRSYSQRQRTHQQRDGPGDSSYMGTTITSPLQPAQEESSSGVGAGAGLKRASSQRQKPRPLIDLTPQYQEPPQHSKKGRGVVPQQIPAGGLVDIATSPEVAIQIPPKMTWRRPGTSGGE